MNELTYKGKNLSEFGVFYDSHSAFLSPERDVEMVEVFGRNGDLIIDNDRFRNVELTFPCFIRQNFLPQYRNVLAYLQSCKGYNRLEYSQEPDHYRMAAFVSGSEPTPNQLHKSGQFPLIFNCKPQRFLKTGDTPISADGESSSYSGDVVEIENPSGLDKVSGLTVDISPVQDLNGYDSPWVGGAGKNLFDKDAEPSSKVGCSAIATDTGITITATATGNNKYARYELPLSLLGKTVTISADISTSSTNTSALRLYFTTDAGVNVGSQLLNVTGTGEESATATVANTLPEGATKLMLFCYAVVTGTTGTGLSTTYSDLQIEVGSTATSWTPYSNICPISGWSSANVVRTVDGDSTTYPISFSSAGTVYGGEIDVVSGVLTVTHKQVVLDGTEDWRLTSTFYLNIADEYVKEVGLQNFYSDSLTPIPQQNAIGNMASQQDLAISMYGGSSNLWRVFINNKSLSTADELKTWLASNPVTFVYELATPITYNLTPTEVTLLTGINYISADCGDVAVIVSEPAMLENPTLFESKPLIRCYGTGTVNINDQYITISTHPYEYVDIDCELMDARYGLNNANQYVSFSTTDYITLKSGNNYVVHDLTKVEITPRWYEI